MAAYTWTLVGFVYTWLSCSNSCVKMNDSFVESFSSFRSFTEPNDSEKKICSFWWPTLNRRRSAGYRQCQAQQSTAEELTLIDSLSSSGSRGRHQYQLNLIVCGWSDLFWTWRTLGGFADGKSSSVCGILCAFRQTVSVMLRLLFTTLMQCQIADSSLRLGKSVVKIHLWEQKKPFPTKTGDRKEKWYLWVCDKWMIDRAKEQSGGIAWHISSVESVLDSSYAVQSSSHCKEASGRSEEECLTAVEKKLMCGFFHHLSLTYT